MFIIKDSNLNRLCQLELLSFLFLSIKIALMMMLLYICVAAAKGQVNAIVIGQAAVVQLLCISLALAVAEFAQCIQQRFNIHRTL